MMNVHQRERDGQCSKVCKRFCIDRGCITGFEDGVAAKVFEQARRTKRVRSISQRTTVRASGSQSDSDR